MREAIRWFSFTWGLVLLLVTACRAATPEPTPTPVPEENNTGATPLPNQHEFYVALDGDDGSPGTLDRPWATVNHAAQMARAGDMIYLRDGRYSLERRVEVSSSGNEDAWITFTSYPGELAILDAAAVKVMPPTEGMSPYDHDQGAFLMQNVAYIRVMNLVVTNSHNAGFTIRDSHHIDLINNATENTFSSGIAAWDTNHDGEGTHDIRVLGNTIIKATTWDMLPDGMAREGEPPHEAISIAGAVGFEVAFNHIHNCDKEGIDVKETSKHGIVHHNYVHDVDRQGIYVDAWFGEIEDIEIYENVVHYCKGAGLVVSVENGKMVKDVRIHHNLIFRNLGSGMFFSRWGDGPRQDIQIYNNTVAYNGYGTPNSGDKYFWLTGGLYFFSTNLQDIDVRNNIFAENRGFQMGYSDHYLKIDADALKVFAAQNITLDYNLVYDTNAVSYPIHAGWSGNYADIFAISGNHVVLGDPLFANPNEMDFTLSAGSPSINCADPDPAYRDPDESRSDAGAFPYGVPADRWWLKDFPPQIAP